MPHQERDRGCIWCGAEFRSTEIVTAITKPGDPEKIAQALAAAADENAPAPQVVRMLLSGDRHQIDLAIKMLSSGQTSLADCDPNQKKFAFEELEA